MKADKAVWGVLALIIGGTMLYLGWHDRFAERAAGVLSIERADSRDRGPTASGGGGRGTAGGGGGGTKPAGAAPTTAFNRGAHQLQDIDTGAPISIGKDGLRSFSSTDNSGSPSTESLLGYGSHGADIPDADSPTIERNYSSEPFGPAGSGERWGTTIGTDPDVQAQQDAYNSAQDALNNRGLGDWLGDHLKDLVPGMYQKEPVWGDPSSYADGTYHDAFSPAGAVAGLLGMASPIPGTSVASGYVGRKVSDALGAEHYTFGDSGGWSGENDGTQVADSRSFASDPNRTDAPDGTATAQAQGSTGPTLGGRATNGGAKLYSIADTLKQPKPTQIAVNPSPKSWENLTTYYSNGDKPTTAQSPVY